MAFGSIADSHANTLAEVQYNGEQSSGKMPVLDIHKEPMLLQVDCPQQRAGDKLILVSHERKQSLSDDYYADEVNGAEQPGYSHMEEVNCDRGGKLEESVNGFPAVEITLPKAQWSKRWQEEERLNNSFEGNVNFLKDKHLSLERCNLSNGRLEEEAVPLTKETKKEENEESRRTESLPSTDLQCNLHDSCLKPEEGLGLTDSAFKLDNYAEVGCTDEINENKEKALVTHNVELIRSGSLHSLVEDGNLLSSSYEPSDFSSRSGFGEGKFSSEIQIYKPFSSSITFHLSTHKVANKIEDRSQVRQVELLGPDSLEEEHGVALWVKWRGKWKTGIRCPMVDCPLLTLKAKPTHERKKYFPVFFPRSKTYCWADSGLVCSIAELPEPLVYGTHRKWRKLVKDLTVPRRYIMQKLAVAMLNISDQLHAEAIVENARKAATWKEFAINASCCGDYSDLGKMLLKLQTMILPRYISQQWLDVSFDSWVQRCESAERAESVEILTEELVNSVLWNEVEALWKTPIQPDLGPEWRTWKLEVMKLFSTAYPRAGRGDVEHRTDDSFMAVGSHLTKRLKHEVHQDDISASQAGTAGNGNEYQVAICDAYSGDFNSQNFIGHTTTIEPLQGGIIADTSTLADYDTRSSTGNEIIVAGEERLVIQNSEACVNELYSTIDIGNLHPDPDTLKKYRQCSAFIEAKGRQCGRWANDGSAYCCVHLNSAPVGKVSQDEQKSLVEAPMCEGTTTHGNKCKHRARYGSAFCKKHRLQGNTESMDCDLLDSSRNELKRKLGDSTMSEHLPSSSTISDTELNWDLQTSMQENLIPVIVGQTLDERNCLMKTSELNSALPSTVSGSSLELPLCIGHYQQSNGEQCLEVAKKHTLYCEKHIPKFLKRARDGKTRVISKDVFLDLLRNCSSRKQKLYLHQACELFYGFMKSNLSRQKSVPKDDSMGWILSEATRDRNVGEYLLKLVSREREKIIGIWSFGMDKTKKISSSRGMTEDLVVHDNGEFQMNIRCKICCEQFSDDDKLAMHWMEIHKKEARWLFRGFACAICMESFTNKIVLESHVKERHGIQLLEHSILFRCMSCDSHFVSPDQLWQHVLSSHSGDFRLQKLTHQHSHTPTEADQPKSDLGNKLCQDNGAFGKDNDSQRFVCRFCGLKFDLLPDLGRHHQVAHMDHLMPKRGRSHRRDSRQFHPRFKRRFDAGFETKDHTDFSTQNQLQSSNSVSTTTAALRTQASETKGLGMLLESHCSDVALALFSEIQKTKHRPSNSEILSIARTTCCGISLRAGLEVKYGLLPENLLLRAAKLCSELNIPIDWHIEGFVCPNGCKPPSQPYSLPPVKPMQYGLSKPATLMESVNDALWEIDECHCVLNSKHFNWIPAQKPIVLCEDLSFGQEPVPVPCVMDEDLMNSLHINSDEPSHNEERGLYMPWQDFTYVTKRLIDPSLGLNMEISQLGCACTNLKCQPENCDHVYLFDNDYENAVDIHGESMRGRFPYDERSRIVLEEGYLVYECNAMCRCDSTCCNRVLQKGVHVKLEVFRTEKKGWAVRAGEAIPRGAFVCEFLGEVLCKTETGEQSKRCDNKGCSYLFDIDSHIDGTRGMSEGTVPYVIDASKYGNVSRFINHSCSPNLVNYFVLLESMDSQLAHVGFYAYRDISIGEELAYDYRNKLTTGEGHPCHCEAPNCRGRLC